MKDTFLIALFDIPVIREMLIIGVLYSIYRIYNEIIEGWEQADREREKRKKKRGLKL